MKVLITGGSGLLGSAISFHFKDYFDVVSTYTSHKVEIKGCKTAYLDIADAKGTVDLIKKIKPKIIVHTSSLVGINACEKEKELAYKIHVEGTKNIVDAANAVKAKLAYISTDYVFDGKKGNYNENDAPNPINCYGSTKLQGEALIGLAKNAVIRTSFFGWNIIKEKKSFSTWIIDELSNGRPVSLFTDQFTSLMLVNDFSLALKEILDKDINGILNVASDERISKHGFGLKLAEKFGLEKNLIKPIKSSEMAGHEKRPLDTSLDISKAKKILTSRLPKINGGIKNLKILKENNYLSQFIIE
ncbi:MAG TPA: SDR family oxidoreductase [Candidatus Nanoarchaeia archaeon]|nr:SDR family oxidoreductase [Candidatus Nanoarchaeia archaeon]